MENSSNTGQVILPIREGVPKECILKKLLKSPSEKEETGGFVVGLRTSLERVPLSKGGKEIETKGGETILSRDKNMLGWTERATERWTGRFLPRKVPLANLHEMAGEGEPSDSHLLGGEEKWLGGHTQKQTFKFSERREAKKKATRFTITAVLSLS